MCFSCYCLFILHALNFVLFLFLLVSGVCCNLCLWHSLDLSINFFWHQDLPLINSSNLCRIEYIFALRHNTASWYFHLLPAGPGSSIGYAFDWYSGGREFDPPVRQHSFMEIGHESISTAILSLSRTVVSHWRKDVH